MFGCWRELRLCVLTSSGISRNIIYAQSRMYFKLVKYMSGLFWGRNIVKSDSANMKVAAAADGECLSHDSEEFLQNCLPLSLSLSPVSGRVPIWRVRSVRTCYIPFCYIRVITREQTGDILLDDIICLFVFLSITLTSDFLFILCNWPSWKVVKIDLNCIFEYIFNLIFF